MGYLILLVNVYLHKSGGRAIGCNLKFQALYGTYFVAIDFDGGCYHEPLYVAEAGIVCVLPTKNGNPF